MTKLLGTTALTSVLLIMIDIETLGRRPNAPIISIGACLFDPATGKIVKEFYRGIDIESACQFGVPDGGTIKWWLQQNAQAREAAATGSTPLPLALKELSEFVSDWTNIQVWANSPSFDLTILEYAYYKCGMSHPWAFWNTRDCRTIAELAGKRPPKHQGVAHNALEDAKHQAKWVSDFWRQIKGAKKVSAPVADSLADDLDI